MRTIPHSKPLLSAREIERVSDLIRSGMLAEGGITDRLCNSISATDSCATLLASSGTQALALALMSLNVKGSYVICPTYSCRALLDAINMAGAKPLLSDITEEYRLSVEYLSCLFDQHKNNISAIIAVHQFGIVEHITKLLEFGVPVVEDCAHYFPPNTVRKSNYIKGVCAVYSFHATKLLTSGEGGAVCSTDDAFFSRLSLLREGGDLFGKYRPAFMSPMSDLQSAVLFAQIEEYDEFLRRRIEIRNRYLEGISDLAQFTTRSREVVFREPIWHECAEKIVDKLNQHGVSARRPVNPMLHHIYAGQGEFPSADCVFKKTFSLPLYPAMTDSDVDYVIDKVRSVIRAL